MARQPRSRASLRFLAALTVALASLALVLMPRAGGANAARAQGGSTWYLAASPALLVLSHQDLIDQGLVGVTNFRADPSGGELDATVDGRDQSEGCPGGSVQLRFLWSLAGNTTAVPDGSGFSVTMQAPPANATPPCQVGEREGAMTLRHSDTQDFIAGQAGTFDTGGATLQSYPYYFYVGNKAANGSWSVTLQASRPDAVWTVPWIELDAGGVEVGVGYSYNRTLSSSPVQAAPAPPGPAPTPPGGQLQNLGGIDWSGYCQSIGDAGASLDGGTINDWHCVEFSGQHDGINVDAACQFSYGAGAVGRWSNFNDPNSWACYGPAGTSPPAPTGTGGCTQWTVNGSWQTTQNGSISVLFSFQQSGTTVTGTASAPSLHLNGTVSGTLFGNQISVVVTWTPTVQGSYSGTVSTGQITNGSTYQVGTSPSTAVSWSGSGPTSCS